jgi:hypothetical protein
MSTFLAEGSGVNMPIQQWPFAIGQEDPVLVVDDQAVMGDLTRRLLARLGFENVEYTNDCGAPRYPWRRSADIADLAARSLSSRGPPGLPFVSSTSQDYTLAIDDLKAMWHRKLFGVAGVTLCFSFGLLDG